MLPAVQCNDFSKGPKDHINLKILQTVIAGIPLFVWTFEPECQNPLFMWSLGSHSGPFISALNLAGLLFRNFQGKEKIM